MNGKAEMIRAGTILQNRYLIENQIGTGGMGRVYLAVDRRFENRVAIKETFYKDDNLREAFEREARLLNGLHHPVLPHVSDYFTEGNEHFLVMEFIEGEDLHEILKRDGAFPIETVLRWSKQMLDALDYLHSQNPPIIHRDIKPQNLKITSRGDIILLDFGLAKLNSEDATSAVSVFGYSRAYSPLEQIQGTGTDARSDIFALAATVFHLLTGKPPIDVLSRAAAIINGDVDPLPSAAELRPEIPAKIDRILQKALSLNPAERFASAKEVSEALNSAIGENTVSNIQNELSAASDFSLNSAANSEKTETFPALQSFAANAAKTSETTRQPIESNSNSAKISTSQRQNSTAALPTKTAANEYSPNYRRKNLSWMLIGVLAAVAFGGSLAVWQFAGKSSASSENIPAAINNSAAETQAISELPKEESAEIPATTNSAPAETSKENSASKNVAEEEKKVSENRSPAVRAENPAKTKNAPTVKQPAPVADPIERPRVVTEETRRNQEEPLPDIERIFTGQTRQQRTEQQRRRAQREERQRARREQRRRMRDRIDDDWDFPPPRRRNN